MSIRKAGQAQQTAEDRLIKWDRRFLRIAEEVATWSKDPGKTGGVGAVLTVNNTIVGTGYNGLPRNMRDVNLEDRDSKLSRTVHAEMNAMLNSWGRSLAGATLYVTPLMVCDRCAVHMIQAGVRRVVLPLAAYPQDLTEWDRCGKLSLQYFDEAGVEVAFMKPEVEMTFEQWRDRQGHPVNSTQEPLWNSCWDAAQSAKRP